MKKLFLVPLILAMIGCSRNEYVVNPFTEHAGYQYLPENMVAGNDNGTILARYVDPTYRYDHGILGDNIEAGGLLVTIRNKGYYYRLDTNQVFEDLQPRMKDVDGDGEPEFITIQTSLDKGASVCIYKITGDSLLPWLQGRYIGTSHRWLNIAAINDLDGDGNVEIAWVETPHIGGTLKIARIRDGLMQVADETAGVSNHSIGSRNLCLSAVDSTGGLKTLYIPSDDHSLVPGFIFKNDSILLSDTIFRKIDQSIPLGRQLGLEYLVPDASCIYTEF